MPSSTSSSDARPIPGGDWRGVWLVALVLAVAMTWGAERIARARHQRPSVTDDAAWWAVHRRMATGRDVVAFLGSSRMELAYSSAAFQRAAPSKRGVQLAIDGKPAFAVLEDLAEDESFVGTAVVDLAEWEIRNPQAWTAARDYIERARSLWRAPGAVVNRYLASHAQSRLAVLAVGGRELIAALGRGRWPEPKLVVADRDRTFHGDYSLASPDALRKRREKGLATADHVPPSPQEWAAQASRLDHSVERIRNRGGVVVFVRLPTSGELHSRLSRLYPREQYWDAFARRTGATTIHFLDVPALASLECPDSMHLDQKDQATFTEALARELRTRGVLD